MLLNPVRTRNRTQSRVGWAFRSVMFSARWHVTEPAKNRIKPVNFARLGPVQNHLKSFQAKSCSLFCIPIKSYLQLCNSSEQSSHTLTPADCIFSHIFFLIKLKKHTYRVPIQPLAFSPRSGLWAYHCIMLHVVIYNKYTHNIYIYIKKVIYVYIHINL